MENMCTVQVKLELGHRAQLRKKATTEGFTHDWMVFVRGPETCDIQHFVERVVFRLHDSFPKPKRVCKEPPYKVEESGYAGFLMPIEVYFKNKEEPKKVCFNYDLFLNLEGNPPVNHLRCEKLTFNNPTHEFRRKLVKAGGVMVVPEGAEMMPRPSPDYPMLPTIPLSAFSDPKKIKSSHGIKEPNKDGAGGSSKGPKPHKPAKEHKERTRKDSESKATSRDSDRDGGKSAREPLSSSFSRKTTESRGKEEVKTVPKAAFKEPKLTLRESKMDGGGGGTAAAAAAAATAAAGGGGGGAGGGGGGGQPEGRGVNKRPSATTESPKLSTKKQKSMKGSASGGLSSNSPRISSTTPSTYTEKKVSKDKSHWAKMRPEVQEAKRQPESDESNSEDEASSKSESAQSSPSSSSSSSSSDSDFEPSQKQGQGPLRSMVEDMHSEGSDDDSSSEVETPMKNTPPIQDARLSMDSESDGVEEPRPPSQEAPSPPHKLSTVNHKMLGKKSPDLCSREKMIKRGFDKVGRAYTEELVDLHRRLMALRERNILQQIVNLIEKTGHFNVTNTTFDFDLFSLDESTVRKLQSYLEATST
ncbi:MLLT1 super elongation complex subunit b isoform X2 [Salminus brasiliensis]|uniref:MLLT1 super elongation complex subunit b isoform X2 n=1 Tax=Salminus brasiliensis TaxID=930266 RepID=UPI003B838EAB